MKICLNCIYFLNCKKADPNIKECDKYKKRNLKTGGITYANKKQA